MALHVAAQAVSCTKPSVVCSPKLLSPKAAPGLPGLPRCWTGTAQSCPQQGLAAPSLPLLLPWILLGISLFVCFPPKGRDPPTDDLNCALPIKTRCFFLCRKETFMESASHSQLLNRAPALQGKVLRCQGKSGYIDKAASSALSCHPFPWAPTGNRPTISGTEHDPGKQFHLFPSVLPVALPVPLWGHTKHELGPPQPSFHTVFGVTNVESRNGLDGKGP